MNKKLHVLFICSWYPSRVLPANGDFIQRHAEAIAAEHQVIVVHTISDKGIKKSIEIEDTTINKVRTIIAYRKFSKNPIIRIFRFLKSYFQLLKRVENFDIIHLNRVYPTGIIALYLKWFKKKPFIISEHWHGYHKPFCDSIGIWENLLSKQIVKNASYVCPVTDNLSKAMQSFGLKNNNYIKVPNVINTSIFKPKNKVKNNFNIIHISSMDKVKNVPKILEAISKLQHRNINFKFYLIGNNANDFSGLSKTLEIPSQKINFINQISQEHLVPYLQKADVLVLFSSIENSPCVILEAFSCGISVISTDVGGISEYFPKGFGTLISKGDSEALLNTLVQSYSTSKMISKKEMHTYVKTNFSNQIICSQFSKIYYKTLVK